MEFITIKQDENLQTVCRIRETSQEIFIHNTLGYLLEMEVIADASDEWTKTIGECLNEHHNPSAALGIKLLSLATNDSVAMEAFEKLVIIGKGDCPECGDELERFGDGNYGKEWEVERCSCGYEHSTEPAFDESYEDA